QTAARRSQHPLSLTSAGQPTRFRPWEPGQEPAAPAVDAVHAGTAPLGDGASPDPASADPDAGDPAAADAASAEPVPAEAACCLAAASRIGRKNWPVYDSGLRATSSGVPQATSRPPSSPPSGPRSMIQSAHLITSR